MNTKKTIIDAVLVDDDTLTINTYTLYTFNGQNVDTYLDPTEFLANLHKYSKDTKICLDNTYKGHTLNGFDLAKTLHEKGYTNFYIFTGKVFTQDEHIPHYLKGRIISKVDVDEIRRIALLGQINKMAQPK